MGPWGVRALAPVECSENLFRRLRGWRHMGTHMTDAAADPGQRRGQTVWSTRWGGGVIAMAWDWAEAMPWVIVLSDPMQILTNVEVDLSSEREVGYAAECIAVINDVVHRLPWQSAVIRHLGGRGVSRGLAIAA